jgi:hypothetical protein
MRRYRGTASYCSVCNPGTITTSVQRVSGEPIVLFLVERAATELTITEATTGLLYQPRMVDDDEYGAVGGVIRGENRSTWRKPAPVPLCAPQISYDLTRARTRAATEWEASA